MPYRAFGDSSDPSQGTFFRRDTISVLYVPSTPAQTTLAAALPAGALDVLLAASPKLSDGHSHANMRLRFGCPHRDRGHGWQLGRVHGRSSERGDRDAASSRHTLAGAI
jgi:hypothetical protein